MRDSVSAHAGGGRARTLVAGMWNAASFLIPMLGAAALSVVIGRLLGPDVLGQQSLIAYVQALLTAMLVSVATDTAVRVLSTAAGAKDSELEERLRYMSLVVNTGGGAIAAVVLVCLGVATGDPVPWTLVALASLADSIAWAYSASVIATQGWARISLRRLVWQSISQIVGIAAVAAGFGIVGVFSATLLAAIGTLITVYAIAPKIRRHAFLPLPPGVVKIWALFMVSTLLVEVVSRRIELPFLGAFSTAQQVAMYSVSFMLVSTAAQIPTMVFVAGVPGVASATGAGESHRYRNQMSQIIRIVLAVSVPFTMGIAVLGPQVIRLLWGSEFEEAASLIPLMSVALLILPAGRVCSSVWAASGHMRFVLSAFGLAAVVDLVLCAWLIPAQGALGAAIANLFGQLVAAGALLAIARAWLGGLELHLGRLAAVSALMVPVGAAVWLSGVRLGGWPGLVAGVLLFAVGCGAVGAIVGFVDAGDRRWVEESLPTRIHPLLRFMSPSRS